MSTHKHWTHYLFWAYLGLIVWLPLPVASKPLWAEALFNILTAALSLAALAGCYMRQHALPAAFQRARVPLLLFIVYCLWLAIQNLAGLSINPFRSWQQWLLTLSYVQLFAITLLLVDTRERLRLLFFVLVACGVFQSLYGGLMTLSGVEKIWWLDKVDHRQVATGTFANRNQLANYLVICLSAGCGLLIAAQKGQRIGSWRQFWRRTVEWLLSGTGWLRLMLAVIVIGIVLTHSRMGNTSLFVSLTLAGLLWLLSTRKSWKSAMILIGSLLLIDTLIVGTWFGLDRVYERLQTTQVENTTEWLESEIANEAQKQEATDTKTAPTTVYTPVLRKETRANELRDEALPDLLAMARAHGTTGIGLGNFSTGFTQYKKVMTRKFYNQAHFDYLQFVIETGVPGFLLLGTIVLYCYACGLLALFRRHSRLLQGAGFAVTMGVTAGLMHAWVEYNFQITANAATFIVLLAIGIIALSLPDKQPHTKTSESKSPQARTD